MNDGDKTHRLAPAEYFRGKLSSSRSFLERIVFSDERKFSHIVRNKTQNWRARELNVQIKSMKYRNIFLLLYDASIKI